MSSMSNIELIPPKQNRRPVTNTWTIAVSVANLIILLTNATANKIKRKVQEYPQDSENW